MLLADLDLYDNITFQKIREIRTCSGIFRISYKSHIGEKSQNFC